MQNMGDVSGFSIDVLHFSPSLHNVNGEKIDSLQVGQQSLIRVSMHNNDQKERPFVIVTEVRDSSGITVFLSWQSGRIDANGNYTMQTSWMPNKACSYENEGCNGYSIRTFAFTDFENPQILSAVSSTEIRVVGAPYSVTPEVRQYNLSVKNETFQIDYSFSNGGQITRIHLDDPMATMTFRPVTPRNSEISITMPKELAQLVFPYQYSRDPEPVFFVDGEC